MTKVSREARELVRMLSGPETGLVSPSLCVDLVTLAKQYHRIQERWCSDDMPAEVRRAVEIRERATEDAIRGIVAQLPGVVGVKFTGDTRGFCVKLMLASGRSNTWGGTEEGWGIG